jgi:hypothetical protein
VLGVAASDLGDVGPGLEPLGHKRADGLQHPQPRPELGAVQLDEAVAGQRLA